MVYLWSQVSFTGGGGCFRRVGYSGGQHIQGVGYPGSIGYVGVGYTWR